MSQQLPLFPQVEAQPPLLPAAPLKVSIGGPGVGEFSWKAGAGEYQLVWNAGNPWMFGTKDTQGKWVYRETSALPAAKTGQEAAKIAQAFLSGGNESARHVFSLRPSRGEVLPL